MSSVPESPLKTQYSRLTVEQTEHLLKVEYIFGVCSIADIEAADADYRKVFVAFLRALPYDVYLQTAHWRSVRNLYFDRFGRICRDCGADCTERGLPIHLHHETYKYLGNELGSVEAASMLTPLCPACHAKRHGHHA